MKLIQCKVYSTKNSRYSTLGRKMESISLKIRDSGLMLSVLNIRRIELENCFKN